MVEHQAGFRSYGCSQVSAGLLFEGESIEFLGSFLSLVL